MSSDLLFGWDLTYKGVEKDIKQKSDVIVAFIHWNLMKRGFRAIGLGDEEKLSGNESKSELLPSGWNNREKYTMRYVFKEKMYILHGLVIDGCLIMNLLRPEDLAVSNMAFKVQETVRGTSGTIDKMLPNYEELMCNIKRDLIEVLIEKATNSVQTQTAAITYNNYVRAGDRRNGSVPENDDVWVVSFPAMLNQFLRDLGAYYSQRGAVPGGARYNPFEHPRDRFARGWVPADANLVPPPGF